jgi:hypothetical protein
MTKKVKKWLDMLPEDIREKVIKAHKKTGWYDPYESIDSLSDLILYYFHWKKSDDGNEYWDEIHDKVENEEFNKIKDLHTGNVKSGSAAFGTGLGNGIGVPPINFQQSPEPIIPKPKYDYINPDHYKNSSKEVIDMMKEIWGKDDLIKYCEMCSFKYRMRLGLKPGQSVEQDLEKARWYESKAKELRNG